jgi:hypothetical protein
MTELRNEVSDTSSFVMDSRGGGQTPDSVLIFMDLMPGRNLYDLLKRFESTREGLPHDAARFYGEADMSYMSSYNQIARLYVDAHAQQSDISADVSLNISNHCEFISRTLIPDVYSCFYSRLYGTRAGMPTYPLCHAPGLGKQLD